MHEHDHGNAVLPGALAGLLATLPMTVAMELMHRQLPAWERYPLPPSEITERVTDELGLQEGMTEEDHLALTLVNHFAYGAAAGALYDPLMRHVPLPPAMRGVAFGLGVWTVSYLGLLPALGILRPATKHPAERNALMISAHVVWGAALGLLTEQLRA